MGINLYLLLTVKSITYVSEEIFIILGGFYLSAMCNNYERSECESNTLESNDKYLFYIEFCKDRKVLLFFNLKTFNSIKTFLSF